MHTYIVKFVCTVVIASPLLFLQFGNAVSKYSRETNHIHEHA